MKIAILNNIKKNVNATDNYFSVVTCRHSPTNQHHTPTMIEQNREWSKRSVRMNNEQVQDHLVRNQCTPYSPVESAVNFAATQLPLSQNALFFLHCQLSQCDVLLYDLPNPPRSHHPHCITSSNETLRKITPFIKRQKRLCYAPWQVAMRSSIDDTLRIADCQWAEID